MRIRLGTRASELAIRQTEWVAARLAVLDPGLEIEIIRVQTRGDRIQDRPLWEIGGKGLFLKEIEDAILEGRVDAGVHSMKDVPAELPPGLALVAVPEREHPGDVLVSHGKGGLGGLAPGSRVGSGSLRRAALVRAARSDVEITALRGNVPTRIRKWREGEVDALILARAGLVRLGIPLPEAEDLPLDAFVPAIGQGALAIEAREDGPARDVLARLDDPRAVFACRAERAVLRALGGDCHTPVAAHAIVGNGELVIDALVARPDGSDILRGRREGPTGDAEEIGQALGAELLERGAAAILAEARS